VQEGAQRRQVGGDTVKRFRTLGDRFLDVGAGDASEGGKGAVEGDEHARLLLGDRGHGGGEALQRPPEFAEAGAGRDEIRQRRLTAFKQRPQGGEGVVDLWAAGREGVAEAGQAALDRGPGFFVEHVEELVDVDRFGVRRRDRDRVAGSEAPMRIAGGDLQVLEAERRFGPDDHRRVVRQWLHVLVEAEAEFGSDLAPAQLHRHHRLDDADPGAADPHLVAFDQGVGVGHPRLEVVGGDEGKPVVGVVGKEDGDDDDQHGHRADDHRAACHSLYAAAISHGPRR
jgi:hypothetical protein